MFYTDGVNDGYEYQVRGCRKLMWIVIVIVYWWQAVKPLVYSRRPGLKQW